MQEVLDVAKRISANVEQVIIGKDRVIRMTVVALLCEGHLLIEDVPGVGKTMLARAIARTVGSTFRRIQFTPDMLPSDVTGVSVFNQKTLEFEFRPGPIMAQIVLSDEINRATPKTQSALLEAMEEHQVTVDGTTYQMARPFMVLATQNPIEYEGTFPLPEAQVDRFLMRIRLGYPSKAHEINILGLQAQTHPIESLEITVSCRGTLKGPEMRCAICMSTIAYQGVYRRPCLHNPRSSRRISRRKSRAAAWRSSAPHGPGPRSMDATMCCPMMSSSSRRRRLPTA